METPPPTPASPASRRRGLGTTEKVVLGCALGCGALILVGILFAVGSAYWLVAPGEQIATERIVSPEALGAIDVRRSIDDPGLSALLTNFFVAIQEVAQRQQREEMPPSLHWMQDLQGRPDQGLRMWIPKGLTLTVEPDPEDEEGAWVLAVNLRSFPRLIRTMVGMFNEAEGGGEVVKIPYGDYTIERLGNVEPTYMTFDGGTLLLAETLPVLQGVLDRLQRGEAGEPPAAASTLGLGEDFASGWDGTAIFANPDDRYGDALRRWILLNREDLEAADLAGLPATEVIQAFALGVDAVTGDEIHAELHLGFDPATGDGLEMWRTYLTEVFEPTRWREDGSALRPELVVEAPRPGVLVARLQLTGVEGFVWQLAERLEEHAAAPPYDPEEDMQLEEDIQPVEEIRPEAESQGKME